MSNELQKIDFHGDSIFAMKDERTGEIYVSVREICNTLGLNFSTQSRRLRADPAFSDSLRRSLMTTPGGKQVVLSIPDDLMQGWLFSIQTNRLKPEIRELHLLYKKECFRVLNEYFTKGYSLNERAVNRIADSVAERIADLLPKKKRTPQLDEEKRKRVEAKIVEALSDGKELSTEALYHYFSNNIDAMTLHSAIENMISAGMLLSGRETTAGKPAIIFRLIFPR